MSIKKTIKEYLIKFLPVSIKNEILKEFKIRLLAENKYSTLSYSQEGEDLILKRIFEGQNMGLYVDIGAHHPKRFSNTYLFYKMGWRGINIDAMPGSMDEFKRIRPKDINLEMAISDKKEKLKYYLFNELALNTFSKQEVEKKNGKGGYKVIDEVIIETTPLSVILKNHLKPKDQIDFMNIDVEGLDLQVLHSLDWTLQHPNVVLIENLSNHFENILESEIYKFLKPKGYALIAKTFNTMIFLK